MIKAGEDLTHRMHANQVLKIKLEVDTHPPGGFETESRVVLLPVPFAVRVYSLPDLFAGKMHALLCRKWKTRVKGRDGYDLVWYLGHHPSLRLSHLEMRLRQPGDWVGAAPMTRPDLVDRLHAAIRQLNVTQARQEIDRFVRDKVHGSGLDRRSPATRPSTWVSAVLADLERKTGFEPATLSLGS